MNLNQLFGKKLTGCSGNGDEVVIHFEEGLHLIIKKDDYKVIKDFEALGQIKEMPACNTQFSEEGMVQGPRKRRFIALEQEIEEKQKRRVESMLDSLEGEIAGKIREYSGGRRSVAFFDCLTHDDIKELRDGLTGLGFQYEVYTPQQYGESSMLIFWKE